MSDLRKINNEIKAFINEANFVSNKCRNKLLKILGETFSVDLPLENFASIDAVLTEEGNIVMRGDEYKSSAPCKDINELEEKYNIFKDKAEVLLKKKEVNYYTKNNINNTFHLLPAPHLAHRDKFSYVPHLPDESFSDKLRLRIANLKDHLSVLTSIHSHFHNILFLQIGHGFRIHTDDSQIHKVLHPVYIHSLVNTG